MSQQTSFKSDYIKMGIVLLFMFGFRLLPPIGSITPYGMAVLGILIGAILGWSFDGKCMTQTSLLALVALATTAYPGGVNAISNALLGNASLLIMCLAMILAGALVEAGMDNYLIAKVMNIPFAKGKPWVITFLLVFSPYVLSIFITNTALILFLLPTYAKLLRGAGYQAGDKYVMHVLIGACLSAVASMYIFPFKGMALAYSGMVQAYIGTIWTYAEYMMTATVFSAVLAAGYTLFMRLIRCDASKMADVDLSVFGDSNMKATKHQKGVLAGMVMYIVGATIISFGSMIDSPVTNFLGKIGVYGWLFAILAVMMIVRVDGKRLMDINSATRKGFSWELILLVGSATVVGGALTSAESGFGTFLSGLIAPVLGGLGSFALAVVMCVVVLLATNFCNNMAIMMIAFSLIGSLAAGGMEMNSVMMIIGAMIFSQIGFLLPASSLWGAILHTADMATPSAVIKNVILTLIYCIVVAVIVFVPLCEIVF